MDKRRIIEAYQKGILTQEQCAQILGLEPAPLGVLLGSQRSAGVAGLAWITRVARIAKVAGTAALSFRTLHTRS